VSGPGESAGRIRRRLLRLESVVAGGILLGLILAAVAGPLVWSADPEKIDLTNKYAAFSADSPLGTDDYGRDILSRLMHGGRRTFSGAAIVLLGSSGVGLTIGALAGTIGGRPGGLLSRLIDAFLGLPSLVIALGIVGALGKSFPNLLLALILTSWPWYARIYRSLFVKQRSHDYVLAAASLGAPRSRIIWRHMGPNVFGPGLVIATVNLGNAMLSLAALSFLGLGVQPPTPEWGAMVSDARFHFQTHPWLIIAPGLAISLSVLSVNILGDALRDAFDPKPQPRLSLFGRSARRQASPSVFRTDQTAGATPWQATDTKYH
jgi:peptide/nickel transport system permease protein